MNKHRLISEAEIHRAFEFLQDDRSQAEMARVVDVTPAVICTFLAEDSGAGPKMQKYLGVKRVAAYQIIEEPTENQSE